MLRILPIGMFAVAVLAGCPGSTGADGGTGGGSGGPAPEVTSVAPDRGPQSGGTVVTVNGANFDDSASVKFGDKAGTQVIVASKRKLTVRAPAGAAVGKVSITVTNLDGKVGTLANSFTYEADAQKGIDDALVLNPATAADGSGAAMISVTILAQVVGPATKGAGQGLGIKAQVGVAAMVSSPPVATDFTWTDASYTGDADGPATGDLARDAYKGDVMVAGATALVTKTYRFAARFSTDNGATWVLADRDGLANGFTEAQLPKLDVTRPTVDWCKLGGEITQPPPQLKVKVGTAGPLVYGQVYRLGVTQANGAGPGIKGQLGYGLASADPTAWTWVDATFNKDTAAGANDEFQAAIPATVAAGVYAFGFRFTLNDGPAKYCDADGSDNDFLIAQAGTLTVTAPGVERCKLQFPSTLDARVAVPNAVYGRVFAAGITDVADAGVGIVGEVGFGPATALPTEASWTWAAGSYNVEASDGTEEWKANLTFPAAGSFGYAFRFKYLIGAYSYCDLDGSENGTQLAQLGAATVKEIDIDDCQVDAPVALLAQPSGQTAVTNSHVRVSTVTELLGQGAGVTAEVGYGPVGSQPSTWTAWQPATFSTDAIFFDRYVKAITAPAAVGTYDVAYRYRYLTKPYVYCDVDGSANGYQVAQAAKLTVASAAISACNLQFVDKATVPSGDGVTAFARVTVPGLSANAGPTPGLRVQVGVGTAGDNASTSLLWGWKEAAFNIDTAGADEFVLAFQPAYNGNRAVSARASLNNGATWTYCDLNGSDVNGYEVAQQHTLVVTDHQDFDFCNLQFPAAATRQFDGGGVDVYGQLYVAGVTPNPAFAVTAQLGTGKKVEDPGMTWTWTSASFNTAAGGNNEYSATLFKTPGTYHYAYRFSRDGGSWCYGDLNGNGKNGGSNEWAGFYGDAPDGGLNVGLLTVQ